MFLEEVKQLLIKNEVILKGHFKLSSGKHSDTYYQIAKLIEKPKVLEQVIAKFIEYNDLECKGITKIISPAIGGIVVGYELARQLKCEFCFYERKDGIFQLRRSFQINPDDKLFLFEDVVTTGKSILEVKDLIPYKENILGIGCIINRSEHSISDLYYLLHVLFSDQIYTAENCELCKNNIDIYIPGSRF